MKFRKSIECWIISENNKILLLHRPQNSKEPSYWQPVTGGIHAEESAEEACIRELQEETSIKLEINEIFQLENNIEVYLDAYDLLVRKTLFITKVIPPKTRIIMSEEHDEFRWVSIEEVDSLLMWESNFLTFGKVKKMLQK